MRSEYEYPIPIEDARELLLLAQPKVLEKRRFHVPHDGLTWEVDVFEGRHQGLVIAEVELDSEKQDVDLPPWLGEEVSHDDRYYNAALAGSEATCGTPELGDRSMHKDKNEIRETLRLLAVSATTPEQLKDAQLELVRALKEVLQIGKG